MIRQLHGYGLYKFLRKSASIVNRYFSLSQPWHNGKEQSNFLELFIQSHKPAQEIIDHFFAIKWAREHLENSSYELVPFFSRYYIELTNGNRFFARTVSTDATIPHLLSLRAKEIKTPNALVQLESSSSSSTSGDPISPEVICLMSLHEGLDAHPSTVHGGFQCVIFDEVMGFLILPHQNNTSKPGPRDIHYTLNMTTKFSAPVVTPCDVLVRARLVGREKRKWRAKAEIANGNGQVLTSAESLLVTSKSGAVA